MRLLHPPQVSGEIMHLLSQARQFVVIVSPYNKIKNWLKLAPYLQRLKARGLPVEYYVRQERPRAAGYQEIVDAGFTPIEIEGLHCKFYLNETHGIVTSMNLLLSSDINALEIGYVTETDQEYRELVGFLDSNIRSRVQQEVAETVEEETAQLPFPGVQEYTFNRLRELPLFSQLESSRSGLQAELNASLSVKIEFRGIYVLVAYRFCRQERYKIYRALHAQSAELEAQVGHRISWGKQWHQVKLEVKTADLRAVDTWGLAEAELLCACVERATPVMLERVGAVVEQMK